MFALERTTSHTLHTVQLRALFDAGALDGVFQVCRSFMAAIEAEHHRETPGEKLIHAYGGLKVALHLIDPIIASSTLFDSAQTLLIWSRDKKDTDPDYFEPHVFLQTINRRRGMVKRALLSLQKGAQGVPRDSRKAGQIRVHASGGRAQVSRVLPEC